MALVLAFMLVSHLGRPKGKPEAKYSLEPVSRRLQELLPTRPITYKFQNFFNLTLFAVAIGLFGWLIGIGGLVGAAVWIASHTTRTKKSKVNA